MEVFFVRMEMEPVRVDDDSGCSATQKPFFLKTSGVEENIMKTVIGYPYGGGPEKAIMRLIELKIIQKLRKKKNLSAFEKYVLKYLEFKHKNNFPY